MKRLGSPITTRSAFAGLAGVLALGIAFYSRSAVGRIGSPDPGPSPDPLVDTLDEDELVKFAVIDMVDALDRVVDANAAASDVQE